MFETYRTYNKLIREVKAGNFKSQYLTYWLISDLQSWNITIGDTEVLFYHDQYLFFKKSPMVDFESLIFFPRRLKRALRHKGITLESCPIPNPDNFKTIEDYLNNHFLYKKE